jgi:Tol biopolymer transport system component
LETSGLRDTQVSDSLVRSQLERIIASDLFLRSERLSRFLRFIVEKSLDGSSGELKEQVLACELYGRSPVEFDTASDPVVRVDARRLRDKLREYYAAAPDDPIVISLPKGSYRPVFERNSAVLNAAAIELPKRSDESAPASSRRLIAAIAITIALIGAALVWFRTREPAIRQFRATPLVSLPGIEGPPALSPDGNFVAFAWSDPIDQGPPDIWIKAVDSEDRRRLTETPRQAEFNPAWSPDGRQIAFVRGSTGVFIVSVLGTGERKIADSGTHVGWGADSKTVLIRDREAPNKPYGIFQVSLTTLEKRPITQAPSGIGDWMFSVSPDGRTLAWVRYGLPGISDLYVAPLQGGEPRRLTEWNTSLGGMVWTPDGREIVYSVEDDGGHRLFRTRADTKAAGSGTPIEGVRVAANHPTISRPGVDNAVRLAFQTYSLDIDLQTLELASPLRDGVIPSEPFLASTRIDGAARFSPDGSRVAFVSYRSGPGEIWVAGRDGSGLRRLTDLKGKETVVGGWSPDGRRIAFGASIGGNSDIYSVTEDGSQLVRLTFEPAMEILPSFSADGRWVYFSRNLNGVDFRVWRVPASGGQAIQITQRGGFQPQESLDGRDLFYLDYPRAVSGAAAPSNLMKMPVGGGEEVTVLPNVPALAWSIAEKGILYLKRENDFDAIDLYRFADQTVTRLGRMAFRLPRIVCHLSFSRDGNRALVTRMVRDDTDLMYIDDFR